MHENSQLKNYLKEKEDVIKLLHEKIQTTKANLYYANEQQFTNKVDLPKFNSCSSILSDPKRSMINNLTTIGSNLDSGIGYESSITTSNSFSNYKF